MELSGSLLDNFSKCQRILSTGRRKCDNKIHKCEGLGWQMLPRWVDDVEREALVAGESLPYMANPDRVRGDPLSETELRRAWAEVNDKLTSAFEGFTWEDWLQKHAAVSV
jgi:hypothetical protein